MNAHAPVKAAEQDGETTALVVLDANSTVAILTNEEEFDAFYARVKAITDTLDPDTSTAKGRDEIRSMARKVVTSKTTLDKAGLALTAEWRANTEKVNATRRVMTERLDALRDEVRKPLTEWETAEKEREADVKARIDWLQSAAVVTIDDTSKTVAARLAEVEAVEILDDHFQEYAAAARAHQTTTSAALGAARDRLTKEEADRAELERLRKADEDRKAAEAKAQAEREAQEAAERAARQAEEDRQARIRSVVEHIRDCGNGLIGGEPQPIGLLLFELRSKVVIDETFGDRRDEVEQLRLDAISKLEAEQKRQAEEMEQRAEQERQEATKRAADEAAARASREAEEKARAEQEAKDRAHQEELEKAKAEAKRLQDEKAAADRQVEQDRLAAEKRAKDRAHRGQIMGAAKEAIMEAAGVSEETAKTIVLAIVAGDVPHTSIEF